MSAGKKKLFKIPLPAPNGRPDLLVVAGEHSGDEHAARMVAEMRALGGGNVCAIGGPALKAAGAQLLADMTEFSVVGLVEVLKNYGTFRRLFAAILDWVERYRPRAICFVDYPGFNLRLAKALKQRGLSKKGGGDIALYYYIGPQIWAWKRARRFAMARTLDALGVIFPFETECYADTELPVSFVGHPFVQEGFSNPLRYDPEGPVLLLPGSRAAAVGRIFPRLLAGFECWQKRHPHSHAVVLYPSGFIKEKLVRALEKFPSLKGTVRLVPAEKAAGFGARAVLMSSGTMSLCCCLAGIPGAIAYYAHPLTYAVGRMVVKIPYLGIANLLLKKDAWPECLQGQSRPENLADALESAIQPERVQQAQADSRTLRRLLVATDKNVQTPARWLLERMHKDGV